MIDPRTPPKENGQYLDNFMHLFKITNATAANLMHVSPKLVNEYRKKGESSIPKEFMPDLIAKYAMDVTSRYNAFFEWLFDGDDEPEEL